MSVGSSGESGLINFPVMFVDEQNASRNERNESKKSIEPNRVNKKKISLSINIQVSLQLNNAVL